MENREQETIQEPRVPLLTRAGIIALPGIPIGILDAMFHGGMTPVALSGFGLALLAAQSPKLVKLAGENERILLALSTRDDLRAKLDAITKNYFSEQIARLRDQQPDLFTNLEPQDEFDQVEPLEMIEALADKTAIAQVVQSAIDRVTVELICEHVERNSYGIYIGRSLTRDGNPAVPLQFYKQHIEIIGVSQKGKSSMAAALMDIITRTHDPEHVKLVLLDMENQTSSLFAHLPHVMTWHGTKLHAHTPEEVIEQLSLVVEIMKYRYTLPAQERANLPVVLVYLEEFLALKNELKNRINLAKGKAKEEEREEAIRAYAQLVLTVNMIALRGLKARIQFLLCAQVDYADKEFREALAMFSIRLSFCVDPDAARAAGFTANDLLAQNADSQQKGEAVVEALGTKDLLLAPDYPLEQRIIELEARQARQWPSRPAEAQQTETHEAEALARPVYYSHPVFSNQASRRREREIRLNGAIIPRTALGSKEPANQPKQEQADQKVRVLPLAAERLPQPTLDDAIMAYNELFDSGVKVSRYNLRDALVAKHFECGESKARTLLEKIQELQAAQSVGR